MRALASSTLITDSQNAERADGRRRADWETQDALCLLCSIRSECSRNLIDHTQHRLTGCRPVIGHYTEDQPFAIGGGDVSRERTSCSDRACLRTNVALSRRTLHPVPERSLDAGNRHRIVEHRKGCITLHRVENPDECLGCEQVVPREPTPVSELESIGLCPPRQQLAC